MDIWSRYAMRLADFKEPEQQERAVMALNHMVTDALRHIIIIVNEIYQT